MERSGLMARTCVFFLCVVYMRDSDFWYQVQVNGGDEGSGLLDRLFSHSARLIVIIMTNTTKFERSPTPKGGGSSGPQFQGVKINFSDIYDLFVPTSHRKRIRYAPDEALDTTG